MGQVSVELSKTRCQKRAQRAHLALRLASCCERNSSRGTAPPAGISASPDSKRGVPGPPSEKSASICLSQSSASCRISQAAREALSVSGSSAIAALTASSVMPLAYLLPFLKANEKQRVP